MNKLLVKRLTLILVILLPIGLIAFMYTSSTPVYKEPPKALTIEGGDTTYHYLPDFTS